MNAEFYHRKYSDLNRKVDIVKQELEILIVEHHGMEFRIHCNNDGELVISCSDAILIQPKAANTIIIEEKK